MLKQRSAHKMSCARQLSFAAAMLAPETGVNIDHGQLEKQQTICVETKQ